MSVMTLLGDILLAVGSDDDVRELCALDGIDQQRTDQILRRRAESSWAIQELRALIQEAAALRRHERMIGRKGGEPRLGELSDHYIRSTSGALEELARLEREDLPPMSLALWDEHAAAFRKKRSGRPGTILVRLPKAALEDLDADTGGAVSEVIGSGDRWDGFIVETTDQAGDTYEIELRSVYQGEVVACHGFKARRRHDPPAVSL